MKTFIAAASAVGTVKGQVFSLVRPCHSVSENRHRPDEFLSAAAVFHRLVNVLSQLLFPAVAPPPRSILTVGNPAASVLVWRENGEPVSEANLVAERS